MVARSNSFFNIDILILSILKKEECYGYEIVKSINEISEGFFILKEGTIYPTVYNLLKRGLITEREEIINRRIRVYYKITRKGIDYLENHIAEFRKVIYGVNKIIEYGESNNEEGNK